MRILVTGASGYIGHNLVNAPVERDHVARCLLRDAPNADRLPKKGVEIRIGDVTKSETLAGIADGVDSVVHLVAIIREQGAATYQAVMADGTRNLLRSVLASPGRPRFVYMSALGTRPGAASGYHRAKWLAEEAVRESGLPFCILRPSFVLGPGDEFVPILVDLVTSGPAIPVIGSGKSEFQPVSLGNMIWVLIWAIEEEEALGRTLEICGPERLSFNEMIALAAEAAGLHKPVLHLPSGFMKVAAAILAPRFASFPISKDQIIMLEEGNTCQSNALQEILSTPPVSIRTLLPELVRQVIKERKDRRR